MQLATFSCLIQRKFQYFRFSLFLFGAHFENAMQLRLAKLWIEFWCLNEISMRMPCKVLNTIAECCLEFQHTVLISKHEFQWDIDNAFFWNFSYIKPILETCYTVLQAIAIANFELWGWQKFLNFLSKWTWKVWQFKGFSFTSRNFLKMLGGFTW